MFCEPANASFNVLVSYKIHPKELSLKMKHAGGLFERKIHNISETNL